jgi:hypothetical protein
MLNDAVGAVQEDKKRYCTHLNRKDKGRYLAVFRHLRVEPQPTGNRLTLSLAVTEYR